jgi:hypothetical protein
MKKMVTNGSQVCRYIHTGLLLSSGPKLLELLNALNAPVCCNDGTAFPYSRKRHVSTTYYDKADRTEVVFAAVPCVSGVLTQLDLVGIFTLLCCISRSSYTSMAARHQLPLVVRPHNCQPKGVCVCKGIRAARHCQHDQSITKSKGPTDHVSRPAHTDPIPWDNVA